MQKYKTQLHLPRLRKKKKNTCSCGAMQANTFCGAGSRRKTASCTRVGCEKPPFFRTTLFVSALIKHEGTYGAQFVLALIEEGDKRHTRRTTTTTTTSFCVAKTRRSPLSGYLEVSRCSETPRGQQALNDSSQTFKLLINFTALRVKPLQS